MIKNCLVCKKGIWVKASKVKMGKGKFCSRKCFWMSGHRENRQNSRLYRIWGGMKSRCVNQKDKIKWIRYGGRGITVCDEWKNSYLLFKQWALNNGYNDNLSIDRINNALGYFPTNCQWTTPSKQSRNRITAKLNFNQVKEIRRLYKTGKYSHRLLGKKFKVASTNISYIVNNKGWQ